MSTSQPLPRCKKHPPKGTLPNSLLESAIEQIEMLGPAPVQMADGHYHLHPEIEQVSQGTFRDGHFKQAAFEAYVRVINEVKAKSRRTDLEGDKLMTHAFGCEDRRPPIRFTPLTSQDEIDEQRGFMYLFKGIVGLRNAMAHSNRTFDDPLRAYGFVTVGRAKTHSGTGRQIPMNGQLFAVFSAHAEWFTKRFGETRPEHYLFPFGKPTPVDPTRPITDVSGAWKALRKRAGVQCRLHDLRHTAATKMAEAGVLESTMLALMGHMSRAMLERYSHIRMAAKRDAVEALSIGSKSGNSEPVPTNSPTASEVALIQ